MFEPILGLPEGVIGFEAIGKVQADDYDGLLMPAIAKGAAAGNVRLVVPGKFKHFGLAEQEAAVAWVGEPE